MTSDAPAINMNTDELAFWKAVFLAVLGDRQACFSDALIAADNAIGELRLRTDDC
jgi:hypothetical protein